MWNINYPTLTIIVIYGLLNQIHYPGACIYGDTWDETFFGNYSKVKAWLKSNGRTRGEDRQTEQRQDWKGQDCPVDSRVTAVCSSCRLKALPGKGRFPFCFHTAVRYCIYLYILYICVYHMLSALQRPPRASWTGGSVHDPLCTSLFNARGVATT